MLHLGAVLAWGAAVAYFWVWWLRPHHNIGTPWFIVNSVVLGWLTLVPLYLLCLYIRGRISALEAQPPPGRVAMVVTKAPSEPWRVVQHNIGTPWFIVNLVSMNGSPNKIGTFRTRVRSHTSIAKAAAARKMAHEPPPNQLSTSQRGWQSTCPCLL